MAESATKRRKIEEAEPSLELPVDILRHEIRKHLLALYKKDTDNANFDEQDDLKQRQLEQFVNLRRVSKHWAKCIIVGYQFVDIPLRKHTNVLRKGKWNTGLSLWAARFSATVAETLTLQARSVKDYHDYFSCLGKHLHALSTKNEQSPLHTIYMDCDYKSFKKDYDRPQSKEVEFATVGTTHWNSVRTFMISCRVVEDLLDELGTLYRFLSALANLETLEIVCRHRIPYDVKPPLRSKQAPYRISHPYPCDRCDGTIPLLRQALSARSISIRTVTFLWDEYRWGLIDYDLDSDCEPSC